MLQPDPSNSDCTYSAAEELANCLTHGVGLVLSLGGLVTLLALAALNGTRTQMITCAVYGACLVSMYAASTLYHGCRSPRAKHVFKVIDHCSIYGLIAGTYTPLMLVVLKGALGWVVFALVWTLALAGILFKIHFPGRFKVLATLGYLGMGWLSLIVIEPLYRSLETGALALLVAGGLTYSLGAVFYMAKRIPFNHAVWHLFVLAGSACHYLVVMLYVAPRRT